MKNIFFKILLIIILLPFFGIIFQSIIVRYEYTQLLPERVDFFSLFKLFKTNTLYLLMNTFFMAIFSSLLTIIISLPVASFLSERGVNNLLYILLLCPILIPQTVYFFGILNVLSKFNLRNTYIGVLLSHTIIMLPYAIINIMNELILISGKYKEVAKTMGAGSVKIFFDITYPLLRETIVNTFSLLIIISFSQYFLTLMIGGGMIKTYSMYIFPLIQGSDRNLSSNAILIYIFINIFIYYLFVLRKGIKKYDSN